MGKVIQGSFKKNIEVDHCAGCKKEIEGEYLEVVLPISDGPKHIALCEECEKVAGNHGVL